MATIMMTDDRARTWIAVRRTIPVGQRIAIGAVAGLVPVMLSMAVVQGAPVFEALESVLVGWPLRAETFRVGAATLLGIGLQSIALAAVGILSALWQRGETPRLALFQASLVAPALVFVFVQLLGLVMTPDAGANSGARVLISGVSAGDGAPVRIVVYERLALEPTECFVNGLLGKGC